MIMNLSVFSIIWDFRGIWVLYDCVCLCFMSWCSCVISVLKMHAHINVITVNRIQRKEKKRKENMREGEEKG